MAIEDMTPEAFNEHTARIFRTALANDVVSTDAIATTAKALGMLVAGTARRDGVSFDELLNLTFEMLGQFAHEAR